MWCLIQANHWFDHTKVYQIEIYAIPINFIYSGKKKEKKKHHATI